MNKTSIIQSLKTILSFYPEVLFILGVSAILFHLQLDISSVLPQNVDFLLQGKDWSQHFLGWHFYRSTPWSFPLGDFTGLLYPSPTNVGYTDSIPLLAIPLKVIAPFVGTFQYIGAWVFGSIFLQGLVGFFLLYQMKLSRVYSLVGAVFLQLSPVLFERFDHPALTAHWIILLAFWVYLQNKYTVRGILFSGFTMVLVSWIHPYLTVMVFPILCAYALRAPGWKSKIALCIMLVVLVVISWYAIGYFTPYATSNMPGLGHYTAHWSTFFYSPESRLLYRVPHQAVQGFEGSSFMGLGAVLGIVGILVANLGKERVIILRKQLKDHWILLLFIGLMSLFAMTRYPVFDFIKTSEIPGALLAHKLFTTFRATGRFIWILHYGILIAFLITLGKRVSKKVGVGIVSVLCVITIVDAPSIFGARHNDLKLEPQVGSQYYENIRSVVSDGQYTHMIFYPSAPNKRTFFEDDDYVPFAYIAAENEMGINIGYLARVYDKIFKDFDAALTKQIRAGELNDNYVYIIPKTHKQEVEKYLENSSAGRELLQLNDNFWYIP